MNSLYTLALRQSSSLSTDIAQLSSLHSSPSAPPASAASLNGQINASLAALDRTVDDYEAMARREIVEAKKEKALSRVARFREEYAELRKEYERVKQRGNELKASTDRSELFAASSSSASPSLSQPYATSRHVSSTSYSRQPPSTSLSAPPPSDVSIQIGTLSPLTGRSSTGFQPNSPYPNSPYDARTNHALREHDFLGQTGAALDGYLAQGQAVLGNLASQRDVLKGTQRRLRSAANTLGLSRSTITFIERRTKEDWYVLVIGGALTLVGMWLILRYFG
ncbi:Synaptobrevin [Rhodotorula toruloides ATCC 204091]|uniref:Protein transport protein BOS1 n=1 Tax=Rhodotorula toruloides TaxID=5286 RepID=A0A0K3CK41_RHOTO|nr:Synaptobrevin [Rhodotorula toruloides ATCC 204091]KAK4335860.1 Synaptobrevin [Rhodotorula toruloides]PRQ73507.1 synaptobrevin [Rhodotorula toruloides]